jgi:hypothetical protein
MDNTVWVVAAERGEYSDRSVWIAGVFGDRETAVKMAESKLHESRAATALFDLWCQRMMKLPIDERGDPPAAGEADDFTVVEVPMNQWGEYSVG